MITIHFLARCIAGCNLLATLLSITVGFGLAQLSDTPVAMGERDHLRDTRYCEIVVVHRKGFSATAAVYNTIGLSNCPEEQWRALDPNRLKIENKAYSIVMNGPRYFVMDRNALKSPGLVRDFDGFQGRLVAQVEISSASSRRQPYVESIVDRESQYVYEAGKRVYELLSPEGKTYIMQSYSLEVDPRLEEKALAGLASRLSLPKGWRYVVRELSEDLTVRTDGSEAHILQDDLKNTYQRVN